MNLFSLQAIKKNAYSKLKSAVTLNSHFFFSLFCHQLFMYVPMTYREINSLLIIVNFDMLKQYKGRDFK